MSVLFENKVLFQLTIPNLTKQHVATALGLQEQDFYLVQNGKPVTKVSENNNVHVFLRLCGGKGGFGSMLRSIGAQIEKTTNKDSCRDLSGRRLRDINEEKKFMNWISKQAEKEKETYERRKNKLEKLCEEPKFEFKDEEYDKERFALPEKVEDAVLYGLQAGKRKGDEKMVVKRKKPKLWVDDALDDLNSSDDEFSKDNEIVKAKDSDRSV